MEPKIAYKTLAESGEEAPVNGNGVAMPDGWPVYKRRCTVRSDIDAAIADGLTLVSVADYQLLTRNYLENHEYFAPQRAAEEAARADSQRRSFLERRKQEGPRLVDEISLKITAMAVGDTERKGLRPKISTIATHLQIGSFYDALDEVREIALVPTLSDEARGALAFADQLIESAIVTHYPEEV